jgi:transcriptional regulator with XRE-family HTH domain
MVRGSTEIQRRLGMRLRELRLAAGLTQSALAARAGLSYKFIGEMERGVGNPTLDSLCAVAQALSVNLADCFMLSESPEESTVRTLSEEDYAAIRDAVRRMKQCLQRPRLPTEAGPDTPEPGS